MVNNLNKVKGYLGIAKKAKYCIFGADNLKGYSHKLYLVLYREDIGNTIKKVLKELSEKEIYIIKLNTNDFNYITQLNNCKLIAIKNKGLSDQIIQILRSEISG